MHVQIFFHWIFCMIRQVIAKDSEIKNKMISTIFIRLIRVSACWWCSQILWLVDSYGSLMFVWDRISRAKKSVLRSHNKSTFISYLKSVGGRRATQGRGLEYFEMTILCAHLSTSLVFYLLYHLDQQQRWKSAHDLFQLLPSYTFVSTLLFLGTQCETCWMLMKV